MKKHYYLEDIISLCTYKHLSADEIFLELKKIYPTIAQASVYRNLERLIKGHVLNKIV
jgi:Fe2+ or Zn2+ uptake regulation protein